MPVPKKRHSNTRTNQRRANWKLYPFAIAKCPQCGSPVLPHHACKNCGTYRGRTVLKIEDKTAKKAKAAQKEAQKSDKQQTTTAGKKESTHKQEKSAGKKEVKKDSKKESK